MQLLTSQNNTRVIKNSSAMIRLRRHNRSISPRITRSSSRKERHRLSGLYTDYQNKNSRYYESTSIRILRKDSYGGQNYLPDILSSLYQRRIVAIDYVSTTKSSTTLRLRIDIRYLTSANYRID